MGNQAGMGTESGLSPSSQAPNSPTPSSQPATTTPQEDVAIPKARVDEMVGKARDETKRANRELATEREARQRLEGRLEALEKSSTPANPPAKTYTRAELDKLVEAEQITLAQRDDQLQLQQEERLRNELEARLQQFSQQQTQGQSVDTQILAYKTKMPEIMEAGSELRARFTAKYQELVTMGQPEAGSTQLVAMQMVAGPLEKIPEKTATATETHAGSGSGDGGEPVTASGKAPASFTARQREHYQNQINAGFYSGWDDKTLIAEAGYAKAPERAVRA